MKRGRPIKYKTESERKAAQKAASANYRLTPKGRAKELIKGYRRADKEQNRGKCTLTTEFILEHIFTQPCAHCGKTGWRVVGCNRLDNSLPHTPDNVEPCCLECNVRLYGEDISKTVYQYTLQDELVAIWPSTRECGRNGYDTGCVSRCCNGTKYYNTHKGYKWSYEPLQKQACQLELKFE